MNRNVKTALIIGGIIVAVLLIVPAIPGVVPGSQYGYGLMGPGMMGNFGGGGFTGMGIGMIILAGLVIWGIAALSRGSGVSCCSGSPAQSESTLEILNKRYARGEINKAEYEDKKKT